MANDGVVWDLAVTLQELLRSQLSLPDGSSIRFVIDVPVGIPSDGAEPIVHICLYEVEENTTARRTEKILTSIVEEDGDLYEYHQFPPLPIVLRFLFVCIGRTREEEFRLLGQVLRIIHDHPVLQGDRLVKGDSVAPDEKVYLAVRSAWGIEAQSRFWQAVGERYRPSVCCQAGVNVDSGRRERLVRVKERVVEVKRNITGA